MSSTKADELKLDIEDLNTLLHLAQRQRSKDALTLEIRRLQTELLKEMEHSTPKHPGNVVKSVSHAPKCYEVKINNMGWDQNDNFVKIYIPLKNVQTLPQESIVCNFTDRSVHLRVLGLDNKNHDLLINNLSEDIVPEKCSVKVKTDKVIVSLAKKKWTIWSCMTEIEKRYREAKNATPQLNKDDDPSTSLVSLMKKMYQDGDDDMKRTIAKAWTESQEKRNQEMEPFS